MELAEIGPGQSVLDIGTGVGEPALTAARRVGPSGRVVAVDQASRMLGVARRRMAAVGLANVEFLEADAEALELPPGAFDAILARWSLMFLPDVAGTLRRLRAALAPGGRLAAAVWDVPERVPLMTRPVEILQRALHFPSPPTDQPGPFALADTQALRAKLNEAGFEDVRVEPRDVVFRFASPAEYAEFVLDVSGGVQALVAQGTPRERLREILLEGLAPLADETGGVRLENRAICVAARVPADAAPGVTCPFCGGRETRLESPFGSTLGFSQHWCERCRTVFEYLKWEEGPPPEPL